MKEWTIEKKLGVAFIALLVIWFFYGPAKRYDFTSKNNIEYAYFFDYPAGGGDHTELPLLIKLHCNPCEAKASNLDVYNITTPVRVLFPYEKETNYWPYDKQRLEPIGEDLIELIQKVKSEFPTSGKPILLGYSGGAFVSYYLAYHDPNEFSAIIPVSGGLPGFAKQNSSNQPSRTKIRAFHGKKDRLVPYSSGKSAVKSLKDHGLDATLYSSKYGGHQFFFDDPLPLSNTINKLIAEQQN